MNAHVFGVTSHMQNWWHIVLNMTGSKDWCSYCRHECTKVESGLLQVLSAGKQVQADDGHIVAGLCQHRLSTQRLTHAEIA